MIRHDQPARTGRPDHQAPNAATETHTRVPYSAPPVLPMNTLGVQPLHPTHHHGERARPPPFSAPKDHVTVRTTLLLVSFIAALLLPTTPSPVQALGNQVADTYAGYEPQGPCRSTAQPGTAELASWLVRNYPGTGSSGTVRACSTGGQSEHKDGRAFDWAADVKSKAQKKAAYDFLARAFATDGKGVTDALARRMGIMYVIYDDKIYSSYRRFEQVDYVHPDCRKLSSLAK